MFTRCPPNRAWAAFALVLAGPPSEAWAQREPVEEAYFRAREASEAGEHQEAIRLYGEALSLLPPGDAKEKIFIVALGQEYDSLVERDRRWACEGRDHFREVLSGKRLEPDARRFAEEGQRRLASWCGWQAPPAPPPPPSQSAALPWTLTGTAAAALIGGVAFSVAAVGSEDDRDAAMRRFDAADALPERLAAFDDAGEAESTGRSRAAWGRALLLTGAVVGAVAVWSWLDGGASPAPAATGNAGPAGFGVRW